MAGHPTNPAIVAQASELWAKGLTATAVAQAVGLSRNAICGLAHKHRDLFPHKTTRVQKQATAPQITPPAAKAKAFEPVRTSAPVPPPRRDAWHPLPDTTPVAMMRVCGCRWPVESEDDRFVRAATYFCNEPRQMKPDRFGKLKQSNYCATHAAMSVGAGTPSERASDLVLARA